jgi:hypothetical protein
LSLIKFETKCPPIKPPAPQTKTFFFINLKNKI